MIFWIYWSAYTFDKLVSIACFFFRWFYMSFEQMAFDIASFLDTAPTSWFAVVNRFLVIYSAYTHDKFILICPLNDQWYCIPFAQKRLGKTSFCALYLVKNSAPVHAFYISFLSLKRYYSIIFFIKARAWSHGIEQRNVSIVVCAGESRLSHARAGCMNLYQSICYYIQRLHSYFPGNGLGTAVHCVKETAAESVIRVSHSILPSMPISTQQ